MPFDVGVKGTLFYYPKDHIKNAQFRKNFKKAIKDCVSNPNRPDSHVLETISGRGTLFQIFRRDETFRRVEGLIEECSTNIILDEEIYRMIEENSKKKEQKNWHWVTALFRTSAIELLLTNRYLDEDTAFYGKALSALVSMQMKNSQIEKWIIDPKLVQNWFLRPKVKDKFTKDVINFKKELQKVKKKLETIC